MDEILKSVLSDEKCLKKYIIDELSSQLEELNSNICKYREKILLIEMILEYDNLKQNGATVIQLKDLYSFDKKTIAKVKKYQNKFLKMRNTMFGYPANMEEYSAVEKYLREKEATLYLINNCGGPNPKLDRGNYGIDTKEIEMNIISLFCKNMNVNPDDYWGYITSGGTEGNYWGIKTGFELFSEGILYFSKNAHYSILKYVRNGNGKDLFPNEEIDVLNDGSINSHLLIEKCKYNWNKKHAPAIVVLTWGTTVYGSCDDIIFINNELNRLNIPHYIHLDAAMYGGISKSQINSPAIDNLKLLNPDSISISLHKYLGMPTVNGVIICKKNIFERKNIKEIDYIGQSDPTILGSRNYSPFLLEYRLTKRFEKSFNNYEYEKNINIFINEMNKNNLKFFRSGNGNTFIIDLPNNDFAKKYQLATFDNNTKAHIIIMPFHKESEIKKMVMELKKNSN